MLKRILTFLLFGVLLFSFAGCGASESEISQGTEQINTSLEWFEQKGFEETTLFTFSIEGDVVWKRGTWIELVTKIQYHGEEPYTFREGSVHFAALPLVYHNSDGSYELTDESYCEFKMEAVWDDYKPDSIKPGEVGDHSFFVNVPEDAPLGKYHAVLLFEGCYYQFFENAIEIVE